MSNCETSQMINSTRDYFPCTSFPSFSNEQSCKLNGFHTEEGLYARNVCDVSQFDTFAFFYAISNFYFLLNINVTHHLKPGCHLCDKHNTSDISISISTRKKEHVPFFLCLCLCLCLCRLCYAYRTSGNQA